MGRDETDAHTDKSSRTIAHDSLRASLHASGSTFRNTQRIDLAKEGQQDPWSVVQSLPVRFATGIHALFPLLTPVGASDPPILDCSLQRHTSDIGALPAKAWWRV